MTMRAPSPQLLLIAAVAGLPCTMTARPAVAQRSSPTASSPALDSARAMFMKYQDPIVAVHDGYHSTVACVETPNGAMGVHFIKPENIGPVPDPTKPTVLLYEPVGKDSLRLTGVEWFVPLATGVQERPQVFGQPMVGPMEGHQPIMDKEVVHYDLHVWLYKPNPAGMFSQSHSTVKCTGRSYTIMANDTPMEHH